MRPITRHAAAALGALALAGTMTTTAHAGTAQSAPAGDDGYHVSGFCPSVSDPTIPGGRAHWELVCADGGVNFFGWVEDTRPDNTDVCVDTGDGTGVARTTGFGSRESFNYRVANTNYVELLLSHC
ncbi:MULTISPECIES: hypothetical protein [Prauserella salsuginis group]|uniref:Secreted protein n=1 Tax=Prauserella salsuginis TaxID=387889 RepID=A0ABW6G999_9PSEU|nr:MULTISPECIES: hypothetical protein [Prauserella salsuginis group]MCR3719465.1 hypothetical protein [Prauserella flava]MCR3735521.1 hypothetical protein [Prauserella salsuginis]